MADNNNQNKCPLCGKHKNEGEEFCKNCKEIAETAYPEELLTKLKNTETITEDGESDTDKTSVLEGEEKEEKEENQKESTYIHHPEKRKKGKKTLIFFFIGLIVLIGVGAAGSYLFIENRNAEETEIGYWEKCLAENTPLAYSKYLVRFPEGKYSEQAYSSIIELKEKERKEWDDLRKSKDTEALISFLRTHPNTPYDREIRYSIDSLMWEATTLKDTKEAYIAYIENVNLGHYSGEYINQAQLKIKYLDQLKPIEGDELKEIQKRISDFFKALSKANNKDIQKFTDSIVVKFNESPNQKNNTIADSIKTSLKKEKIRSITYNPIIDSLKVIKDNKDIYIASVPIRTTTVYTDRKKQKKNEEYSTHIELNKDREIQLIKRNIK